jgi:hypothetical protein
MKPVKVIFGTISFYEKGIDGDEKKAEVYEVKGILIFDDPETAERNAELMIDNGIFDSYLIPSMYMGNVYFHSNVSIHVLN